MSKIEAKIKWTKYMSLAQVYQERANTYRENIVNREVPVLFTEQCARTAERMAQEMEQWL